MRTKTNGLVLNYCRITVAFNFFKLRTLASSLFDKDIVSVRPFLSAISVCFELTINYFPVLN